MEHTNRMRVGARSELTAAAWLLAQGYDVFKNVAPLGHADLIIRHPVSGDMLAVDVRTTTSAVNAGPERHARIKILTVHPGTLACAWWGGNTYPGRGGARNGAGRPGNLLIK